MISLCSDIFVSKREWEMSIFEGAGDGGFGSVSCSESSESVETGFVFVDTWVSMLTCGFRVLELGRAGIFWP